MLDSSHGTYECLGAPATLHLRSQRMRISYWGFLSRQRDRQPLLLAKRHAQIHDQTSAPVLCVDDEGRLVEIQCVQRKVSLCFISTMKVK